MSRLRGLAAACVGALAIAVTVAAAPAQAPGTATAPAGPVVGACHISPMVQDLDKAAYFYHDLLGLDLVPTPPKGSLPWDTEPGHLTMHGLPQARLRFIGARMPGVRCGVELVEIERVDRKPVQRRLQDPGAVMAILIVRDIDAAHATLKKAGVPIVSTGGAPLEMSTRSKTRAMVVKDPDGHFVELAQLDPTPETAAPITSNVIGIRLRVTVADLERTVGFYQRALGLPLEIRPFAAEPRVMKMSGLPESGEYRLSLIQVPGSSLILEFIEFRNVGPVTKPVVSRVQDPGSYRLQLTVRDIDATLKSLKAEGSQLISSGGTPATITFGTTPWRLAVLPDPDNLFLVVQQPQR
jgi:catechol 2,3-dioxygenase-like lactoylglutathione lyase family enzyme